MYTLSAEHIVLDSIKGMLSVASVHEVLWPTWHIRCSPLPPAPSRQPRPLPTQLMLLIVNHEFKTYVVSAMALGMPMRYVSLFSCS